MSEADITVNGMPLTQGQAMTVRVALTAFWQDMRENGLGDDDHGIRMAVAYEDNAADILRRMGVLISTEGE